MRAGSHEQVSQLMSDGPAEQRARVDTGLLGHPLDAVQIDRREHPASRSRIDERIPKRQFAAPFIYRASSHEAKRQLSGSQWQIAVSLVGLVSGRRSPRGSRLVAM